MKVIQLHQEEAEIIQLAIDNNRQAQQQIYSKFSSKMLSVCRQYIKDIQLAEDVMITSFMKVFTNLKRFENKGSFEGWIKKIMINKALDHLKLTKQYKNKVDFNDKYPMDAVLIDNEALSNIQMEELHSIIQTLPAMNLVVFNLYAIEGYSHKEIAEELNINEGTSRWYLANARQILKVQLQKRYTNT